MRKQDEGIIEPLDKKDQLELQKDFQRTLKTIEDLIEPTMTIIPIFLSTLLTLVTSKEEIKTIKKHKIILQTIKTLLANPAPILNHTGLLLKPILS